MIPTLGEIVQSVFGAWRLARGDAGGLVYFDASIGGFWRSFYAAVLIAPVRVAFVLLALIYADDKLDPARVLPVEAISYVIGWTVFPLAMFYVARALDRESRYTLHIVAYNWAQVIEILISLPIVIFATASGIFETALGAAIVMGLYIAFLIYETFIAREALKIPVLAAVGVAFLNFVLMQILLGVNQAMSTA